MLSCLRFLYSYSWVTKEYRISSFRLPKQLVYVTGQKHTGRTAWSCVFSFSSVCRTAVHSLHTREICACCLKAYYAYPKFLNFLNLNFTMDWYYVAYVIEILVKLREGNLLKLLADFLYIEGSTTLGGVKFFVAYWTVVDLQLQVFLLV